DDGRQSREQIGRFIPLRPSRGDGTPAAPTFAPNADPALPPMVSPSSDPAFDVKDPTHLDAFRYGDDQPDDPGRPLSASDSVDARLNRYAFANRLFDYFCVTSPHDDAVPNYPSQPNWQPATAYVAGDVVQYGQHLFVCKQPHVSSADPAATRGAPDWLIAGVTAAPPEVPYPTPPVETRNWLPLARYPLANGAGPPGSRNNLVPAGSGNPSPTDAFTADDANEIGLPVPGRINLNTAPEKVLAALPWSVRVSGAAMGDRLTFHFDVYPPTVDFTPDGIDDNAQIAHAIVLYRDGRYAGEAGVAGGAAGGAGFNALDIAPSSQTWAAAERPFRSLFDLYRVPGVLEAQRATLTAPPQDPGYQTHGQSTRSPVRFDFEAQTLLMNRISSLLTTRSDAFTLYALVQGWRDAGTDHARLVAQRRTALRLERRFDADGRCRVVPVSIIATR
ncbi:MAG: carbohydrate-binding protein, partial [Tepidisphaeraceae bacterium]